MQSKQQKKRRLRIGTWNVRTLLQAGKLENLKEETRRNKVDVMGISEVRWKQSGELMSDEFRMFYSSGDAKGSHGVGVVFNTWQKYVEELYETRKRSVILDIGNETDISEDEKRISNYF